VRAAVS